jgi:hypothetical protein
MFAHVKHFGGELHLEKSCSKMNSAIQDSSKKQHDHLQHTS